MQSLSCVALLSVCITAVIAQSGPTPPRLNIPGAIPIGLRPQFRNDKLVRIRRPIAGARPAPLNAIPIPVTPRILEEAKPVTEEPEDDAPPNFIAFNTQPIPQPSALPQIDALPLQQDEPSQEPRFPPQERQFPPQERQFPPQERQFPPQSSAQRFVPSPERKIVRRPAHREPRPQFDQEAVQTIRQTPVRRPIQNEEEDFQKKPVAQILRKYRDEHEDGSITWGFENDDGSFKEETIGVDCVTRGRYGYIDPDGVKREYNYETGIICDPNKRDQTTELEQGGFVDYEGNKAILPNGVEVDLSNMGKKKSKRPGAFIPQVQPQPTYRN